MGQHYRACPWPEAPGTKQMCAVQGLWSSVWADGAPSTSAALRLYMADIIPLIHQGTSVQGLCSRLSQSW